MDFKKFRKILEKNNIKLFDYEYRISYNRIFNMNKICNQNNQYGGGDINSNIFKLKSKNNLENIINYSLSKNMKLGYLYYLIYT